MTGSQWVFKPVLPLEDILKSAQARRANIADPMAKHYAGDDVYKRIYSDALKRLSKSDMLTLDQAASRLSIAPDAYVRKAEEGAAILIRMGDKAFVPAWSLRADGTIDGLKVDIAREFEKEGQSYFKFLDFFKFMTEDSASINAALPKDKLKNMFRRAGLQEYKCSATIAATMNQLVDQRDKKPAFWDILIQHLDSAVTHGGWDPSGGLSRYFRDKYGIPGLTIDEARMATQIPKPPQP